MILYNVQRAYTERRQPAYRLDQLQICVHCTHIYVVCWVFNVQYHEVHIIIIIIIINQSPVHWALYSVVLYLHGIEWNTQHSKYNNNSTIRFISFSNYFLVFGVESCCCSFFVHIILVLFALCCFCYNTLHLCTTCFPMAVLSALRRIFFVFAFSIVQKISFVFFTK